MLNKIVAMDIINIRQDPDPKGLGNLSRKEDPLMSKMKLRGLGPTCTGKTSAWDAFAKRVCSPRKFSLCLSESFKEASQWSFPYYHNRSLILCQYLVSVVL